MKELQIIYFTNNLLGEIVEIEKFSFTNAWTNEMFLSSDADNKTSFKIIVCKNKAIGYCLYKTIDEQAEILKIAVHSSFRRQLYAQAMMEYMIKDCLGNGVKRIFLEVADDNIAAIKLYMSFGFEKLAERKNYYKDKDALVLRKNLL
jgi:ribosomal-protein-alanine N-acetyltransferase